MVFETSLYPHPQSALGIHSVFGLAICLEICRRSMITFQTPVADNQVHVHVAQLALIGLFPLFILDGAFQIRNVVDVRRRSWNVNIPRAESGSIL